MCPNVISKKKEIQRVVENINFHSADKSIFWLWSNLSPGKCAYFSFHTHCGKREVSFLSWSVQPNCRWLQDNWSLRETHPTEAGGGGNTVLAPLSLNGTREIHYDTARAHRVLIVAFSLQCPRMREESNLKHFPWGQRNTETAAGLNLLSHFEWGVNTGRNMRWSDTACLSKGEWPPIQARHVGCLSFS